MRIVGINQKRMVGGTVYGTVGGNGTGYKDDVCKRPGRGRPSMHEGAESELMLSIQDRRRKPSTRSKNMQNAYIQVKKKKKGRRNRDDQLMRHGQPR